MSDSRDLVAVAHFHEVMEAEILSGRLRSEGIETFVLDTHSVSMQPHLAQSLGGIRVQVMRKDLERARTIFSEAEKEKVLPDPCPRCSSANTELVKSYSLKSLFNLFTFPISFSLYKRSYRCKDCGDEWK
jgi:hypothetical protein